MEGKTLAQVYALVLGAVLVLVGILGFLVEPTSTSSEGIPCS